MSRRLHLSQMQACSCWSWQAQGQTSCSLMARFQAVRQLESRSSAELPGANKANALLRTL